MRSPADTLVLWLGQGFGSGWVPVAPGTAATVLAAVLLLPLRHAPWPLVAVLIGVLFVAGVWICGRSAVLLGAHDHPSIVFDEMVGLLVAVAFLPLGIEAWIGAVILFRLFDILKPWPIAWLDSHVGGGLGIMLDDIAAGLLVNIVLRIVTAVWPAATG